MIVRSRLSFLLSLACTVFGVRAHAQPFEQIINPFNVVRNDASIYLNPFAGGLVQPRIGLADADGDGRPDLFTLNPDNRLRLYRNEGQFGFRYMHQSAYGNAPVRSWFRLSDIDGDGDLDLLTAGALSEVLFYRNGGTLGAPEFPGPPDTLRYGDTKIFTQQETVPSLADIDNDGDLDLFSGNVEGSISFYRNTGTATAPSFAFVTARFADILVISASGGPTGPKGDPSSGRVLTRHGASVLDFIDMDRDGDLDILFGDFFTDKLLFFKNTGTSALPSFGMDRLDTAFLPNGDVVSTIGFNQPVSADLDGDGDTDVLVSSLYPLAPDQPIVLYENMSGPVPGMPIMRRRTLDISNEIDVGSFSAPARLSDNTREGVLIGSSDGSITYFAIDNTQPQISWNTAGRFQTITNLFQAVPAAADLNADGEAEIIVGDANDGRIRMFHLRNGVLQNTPWQLDTFRVNQYAAPSLVDLDGNGTIDLFVGAGNGRFVYFRNTGTPGAPVFNQATPPPPFDALDLGQNSTIAFHDLNGDARPDAIVGARSRPDQLTGFIRVYLNQGSEFVTSNDFPEIITDRNPIPMALRIGTTNYLFIGQQAGGVLAFRDMKPSSAPAYPEAGSPFIAIAPSLLRGGERMLNLRWNIPGGNASLGMFDLLGREVFRMQMEGTNGSRTLGLPDLPSGTYQVMVEGRPAGRIVILD